ncbi:MAG: type II toxin-antitoxin system RelE/ParE family toxin [Oscillospiraceae bacterium]|mgnify:CR=1 FL=1|jgi:mRNA interferase RelE/StbE|nr:type II toxin-antitoxin system RelE/ParE family toxin [Oscillospiraceae bacterium]
MNIIYSKSSVKVINSMDKATKQRIKAGIEKIPEGDIKPLQGIPGTYRLRVGGWRILFSYPECDTILIEKIGLRGVYKGV